MPRSPRSSNSQSSLTIFLLRSMKGVGLSLPSGIRICTVPDCSTMKRRLLPSGGLSITRGCTSPSARSCSFTWTTAEAGPAHMPSTTSIETNIVVSRRVIHSPFCRLRCGSWNESGGILTRAPGHRHGAGTPMLLARELTALADSGVRPWWTEEVCHALCRGCRGAHDESARGDDASDQRHAHLAAGRGDPGLAASQAAALAAALRAPGL